MTEFPEEHPLADYDGDLDTHADHLEAYADILQDIDPDDIDGAMVVLVGADGTDTLPSVAEDVDSRWASLWMLGAHIHHTTSAAQQSGDSSLSMEHVAQHAIDAIREHSGPQETYDEEVEFDGN